MEILKSALEEHGFFLVIFSFMVQPIFLSDFVQNSAVLGKKQILTKFMRVLGRS